MTCDKICIMSDKILQPNDNTQQLYRAGWPLLCGRIEVKRTKKIMKKKYGYNL